MSDVTRSDEPHDVLTHLCNDMIEAYEGSDWANGDEKVCVFISDDSVKRSGIGFHGFENDDEAIAYLIMHLKAMFEATGRTIAVVPINRG